MLLIIEGVLTCCCNRSIQKNKSLGLFSSLNTKLLVVCLWVSALGTSGDFSNGSQPTCPPSDEQPHILGFALHPYIPILRPGWEVRAQRQVWKRHKGGDRIVCNKRREAKLKWQAPRIRLSLFHHAVQGLDFRISRSSVGVMRIENFILKPQGKIFCRKLEIFLPEKLFEGGCRLLPVHFKQISLSCPQAVLTFTYVFKAIYCPQQGNNIKPARERLMLWSHENRISTLNVLRSKARPESKGMDPLLSPKDRPAGELLFFFLFSTYKVRLCHKSRI